MIYQIVALFLPLTVLIGEEKTLYPFLSKLSVRFGIVKFYKEKECRKIIMAY
jgi:hypothetical protein